MSYTIHAGDCVSVMAGMDENSIDTCITDPPYELGFMGKKWDSSGIAFQPETWQAVFRVLKPGAILLAFGGTRTYHRIACAIEDAGFEIRDTIAWVYGSGFPKSYDISKGIDKQAGAEREVVGKYESPENTSGGKGRKFCHGGQPLDGLPDITAPSTPEAQLWHGWGTALKPAFEPIVVAMKPIDGTFVNNALTWGVAGLWIDGGRISANEHEPNARDSKGGKAGTSWFTGDIDNGEWNGNQGRFPANLIHSGEDEVVECFPQSNAGNKGYTPANTEKSNADTKIYGFANYPDMHKSGAHHGDSGSAARFFKQCEFSQEEQWQLANIAEKNSSPQRNQDDFVQKLAQILERHEVLLSEQELQVILDCIGNYSECIQSQNLAQYVEQLVNTDTTQITQNRLKSSGSAQPAIDGLTNSDKLARAGQKSEQHRFLYCPKASRSERNAGLEGTNHHPTIKPIELMRYLVRLTKTPTGGVVLDPFTGSGTTGIACVLEGREFIGIEREQDYIEIAEKRIEHWAKQPKQLEVTK